MNYLDLLEYLATHPIQSFFIGLVQFIILMKLHHKVHNIYLHIALALWFLPQDFVINVVLFTLIGVEWPRETTVTARLKRWKKAAPEGMLGKWRFKVGWTLCTRRNREVAGHG